MHSLREAVRVQDDEHERSRRCRRGAQLLADARHVQSKSSDADGPRASPPPEDRTDDEADAADHALHAIARSSENASKFV